MTARSFLLSDWFTARGNTSTIGTITQNADQWLSVLGVGDLTFWIDVADVTNPTNGFVLLNLESGTGDETGFLVQPVAGPIALAPTTSGPMIAKTASGGGVPLSNFLRWRITTTGAGAWSATFRIRVMFNRTSYFTPTQLSGCLLWLRADLGMTLSGTFASGWADQSGNRNNASQGTPANQPPYVQNAMNGWPALQGNGSSNWDIPTSSFTLGTDATLIAACQPAATTQNNTARLVEHKYNQTYYLGCDQTGQKYKFIVNNTVSPFGTAEGGSVALANTIVTGTYASATTTGTLYVNGTSVATSTFTTPTPTSLPLHVMHSADSFVTYWNGYLGEIIIYNRALAASELTRVHRYLGARYGVSVP